MALSLPLPPLLLTWYFLLWQLLLLLWLTLKWSNARWYASSVIHSSYNGWFLLRSWKWGQYTDLWPFLKFHFSEVWSVLLSTIKISLASCSLTLPCYPPCVCREETLLRNILFKFQPFISFMDGPILNLHWCKIKNHFPDSLLWHIP